MVNDGRVVLLIGAECATWQPLDFANAARFAYSVGCDSIAPQFHADDQAARDAVLAAGCGFAQDVGEPVFNLSNGEALLSAVSARKETDTATIWLDDYAQAKLNPPLVHQITSIFGSSSPVPPPPAAPAGWQHYIVQVDESLEDIAGFLKLGSWFSDLYQPNMGEIEATARAHGQPNSEQGKWIYPGEVLKYRR